MTDVAVDLDHEGESRPILGNLAAQPIDQGLWSFLPNDAIGVIGATLDGPGLYTELVGDLVEDMGQEKVDTKLAEIRERYGFDLEQDVFANLGGGAFGYMLPIRGVTGLPEITLAVQLRDGEGFAKGLDGLLSLLVDRSGDGLSVRSKPYRGVPVWTFAFEQSGGPSGMLQRIGFAPSLTIVENHLLVTLTSLRAKREIKRALKGEFEPHPLTSGPYAPPAEATAYAYLDWQSLLNGIYEGVRGVVGLMGAMGGGEMPIDPSELPEPSTFTRFFEPTVAWYRPTEDGARARFASSFGPETVLGLGSVGFMGMWMTPRMAAAASPSIELEVEEDASGQ